jgi:septum formation protein
VVVPNVEEVRGGDPEAAVVENARRKARAGLETRPNAGLVLGVDTDVVLDGRLLGKAEDEASARERLEALSGCTHRVLSGIVVLVAAGGGDVDERSGLAESLVTFRDLDSGTLALYLRSGEWRDRAGAYAVQGLGSILIERLEGDFSNVVGLPLGEMLRLAPELFER